uniref:Secreted protein n=1 Tax=Ciona intestinalis TaxID=7719 RepID=H2XUK3_CIOIN
MKLSSHLMVMLAVLRRCLVMGAQHSTKLVSREAATVGRAEPLKWTMDKNVKHHVNKNQIFEPFPDDTQMAMF